MVKTMEELMRRNQMALKRAVEEKRAPVNFEKREISVCASPSLGGNMSELLGGFSDIKRNDIGT